MKKKIFKNRVCLFCLSDYRYLLAWRTKTYALHQNDFLLTIWFLDRPIGLFLYVIPSQIFVILIPSTTQTMVIL